MNHPYKGQSSVGAVATAVAVVLVTYSTVSACNSINDENMPVLMMIFMAISAWVWQRDSLSDMAAGTAAAIDVCNEYYYILGSIYRSVPIATRSGGLLQPLQPTPCATDAMTDARGNPSFVRRSQLDV